VDSFVLLAGARRQLAALPLEQRKAFKVALGLLAAGYEQDPPRFAAELQVQEAARHGGRAEAVLTGRIRIAYRLFDVRGGGRQLVVEAIEPNR
jgi:hypothetical protein